MCDICEKMYVVHKELMCDWVKSKVAKCKFYLQKNSKRRRTGGKFTISSTKFHVNFFSVVLDNVVRIRDKMQVVYKEMACDRARSNMEKWDLIGRIQFKYMKNCPMFM